MLKFVLQQGLHRKKHQRRWTWLGRTKKIHSIDYFIIDENYMIKDDVLLLRFNAGSDCTIVGANIENKVNSERHRIT